MNRQEYREKLAARLRGARAESGLSQVQVEQATGIDTSRLSRIEKGERARGLAPALGPVRCAVRAVRRGRHSPWRSAFGHAGVCQ